MISSVAYSSLEGLTVVTGERERGDLGNAHLA